MSQSSSGEWSLSASPDLKAEALEFGISCLRQSPSFMVPGDPDDIEAAVTELLAVTSRPPWMDDDVAIAYDRALNEALKDYPIDVVQLACKRWRMVPNHGKWWPTEQDLRQQCELIFAPRKTLFNKARMLLQDLRSREADERARQPSPFAGDKERQFRNEMRKRFTPERFNAYFEPHQMMFSEREIWVRTQTAERVLTEEGGDLLRVLGLRVRYQPQAFAKVRQPTWEDDTPEEREATARKFNRLREGMEKGEDLARLRKLGAI